MIKQAKKQLLMAAALAALGLSASASFAKDVVVDTKGEVPYVIDSRAVVARSGHDLCWRTGYWTPAAAANTMAGEFPVGLGSDGAASNNRLDLWREMLQASLLAKLGTGDASSLPAHEALRMATLHGARALGMDEHIGSLLPGKAADICALRIDSPDSLPLFDAASHLVYVLGRHNVSDVWINGQRRLRGGELLQISNTELLSIALLWQNKLRQ